MTAETTDRTRRRLNNKHRHNISTLEKALAWTIESAKASGMCASEINEEIQVVVRRHLESDTP
jgi:transcriptional regulator